MSTKVSNQSSNRQPIKMNKPSKDEPLSVLMAYVKNELINMIINDSTTQVDDDIKPMLIKTIEDASYWDLEKHIFKKTRKLRNPTH